MLITATLLSREELTTTVLCHQRLRAHAGTANADVHASYDIKPTGCTKQRSQSDYGASWVTRDSGATADVKM
jgi:hypothetical protein